MHGLKHHLQLSRGGLQGLSCLLEHSRAPRISCQTGIVHRVWLCHHGSAKLQVRFGPKGLLL